MRHFLLILMSALALCGCRPEGVDGEVSYAFMRIVTFRGNDADGKARFEFVPPDGSDLIELRAQIGVSVADSKPPCRMLIRYEVPSNLPYAGGDITLLNAAAITQGDVALEWKEEYERWDSDPVYLYSVSLAGSYVDMRIGLPYSHQKRVFGLALDPATATDEVPELLLVHSFSENPSPTFDRTYYVSFSLAPLIHLRPDLKKVRVRLHNTNLPQDTFELTLL